MTGTPEPTPIFWGTAEATKPLYDQESLTRTDLYTLPTEHSGFTYPKEWDGERCVIVGLDPITGLPWMLTESK